MGNGYLGKISAIVTANTGDFKPKLDAAASTVTAFAKTVQRDLTSSSTRAARALESIYTPLQRVDRGLQAAASMKLSFKGFDGLIQNVEGLNRRLAELGKRQVAVDVKATGFETVDKLREAIRSIKSDDISFVRQFGGLGEARALRGAMTGKEAAVLDKFNGLQSLRQIEVAIDVVGEQGLVGATAKAKALASATIEIFEPLAAARAQYEQLGAAVQVAFGGALKRAQNQAQALSEAIDRGDSASYYDRVRERVERLSAAMARLKEANELANSGASGQELAFQSPATADALRGSVEASRAAALAPYAVRSRPGFADSITELSRLRQEVVGFDAEVSKRKALGLDTTDASARLQEAIAKSEQLKDSIASVVGAEAAAKEKAAAIGQAYLGVLQAESQQLSLSGKSTYAEVVDGIERANAAKEKAAAIGQAYLGVLQAESQQLSLSGKSTYAEVVDGIEQENAARERAIAVGQAYLGVLQEESQQLSLSGRSKYAEVLEDIASKQAQVKAAANFGGTVADAFDEAKIRGYKAQLATLKEILVRYGVDGGEAAERVNELADALVRVYSAKKQGDPAALAAIAMQANAAASAVGAATPLGASGVATAMNRAGDVGRMGADKFSLGLQQAAFAVDDFFSVTGGFEQRMRAVGNNLTQLGFIIGGTSGLFTALGLTVGVQVASMMYKFANAGVTSEDRVKSLNDSLARQKSLVESLAEAFRSLSDSIANQSLSAAAKQAREFSRQVDDIKKKQKESRERTVADLDPDVQRERGTVARLNREIEASDDPAQRVALTRQKVAAEARERAATRRAADRPPPTQEEVRSGLLETIRATEFLVGGRLRRASREQARARERQAVGDLAAAGDDPSAMISVLEGRLAERQETASRAIGAGELFSGEAAEIMRAREDVASLVALIESLRLPQSIQQDKVAIQVIEAASSLAESLGESQSLIEKSVAAGIPGARAAAARLDELGNSLKDAMDRLEEAAKAEPADRDRLISEAEKEVDAVRKKIEASEKESRAIDAARISIERFGEALDRVAQEAQSNFEAARKRADDARASDLERGLPRTAADRRRAQEDFERQRGLRDRVNEEVAAARERARGDETVAANEQRIAEIDRQLQAEGVLAPGQREELLREKARLQADNEARVQRAVDSDPAVQRARDDSTREERRQQQRQRGRDALLSPSARAGMELGNTLQDINAEFESLDAIGQALRKPDFDAANRRVIDDAMRQTAPAIFDMADAVQNAVMQGPSRAALQANDITTTQGAAELNRLLRGDDSAKDQNLVELQKQSQALDELVAIARENGAPPGIFDN